MAVTFILICLLKCFSFLCDGPLYFSEHSYPVSMSFISTAHTVITSTLPYTLRVVCILSFWLSCLHKYFFVKIPLELMPKTEYSPVLFVSWEGENWDLLCIIALTTMHYANTKVATKLLIL